MGKHPLSSSSSSPRPSKRRQLSSPCTPSTLPTFHTPSRTHTPYPPHPSDSPTNPLGLKRTERLKHTLPAPTSFSKHLPLRFQLIRRGVPPRMGGVHRVVQVPLSYTFTHLRCLLSFLFHGRSLSEDEDHLFEVKRDVGMYSPLYKPGEIRKGTTWVKLSTVRDPGRCVPLLDDSESLGESESEAEADGEEWYWADEEELTLQHVWPKGLSTDRGIIYHHSNTAQIHITLNTTELPRRKGTSNIPYVFRARGRVRLTPSPLPQPIFATKSPGDGKGKGRETELFAGSRKSPRRPLSQGREKPELFAGSRKSPRKPLSRTGSFWEKSPKRTTVIQEHDTDTDAEGETDPEHEVEGNVEFDDTHPFFSALSSSPLAPSREDEDEELDRQLSTLNPPSSPCPVRHSPLFTPREKGEEGEEEEEDYASPLEADIARWNREGEFEAYLRRYTGPFVDFSRSPSPGSPIVAWGSDDDDDDEEVNIEATRSPSKRKREEETEEEEREAKNPKSSPTPPLTLALSSLPSSPSLSSPCLMPPPTSSPRSLSHYPSSRATSASASSPYNPLPYHFLSKTSFPKYTPAPPKAHRERIKRVVRRMEKWKKGEWMCARDEDAEGEGGEEEGKEGEGEGGEGKGEKKEMTEEEAEAMARSLGKPEGVSLKDWDCFGDEIEV